MVDEEHEIWWLGSTVDVLKEEWPGMSEDWDTKHMTFVPQTDLSPPGIRVAIDGKDRWVCRRKLQKTFRAIPDDLEHTELFVTHHRAVTWRDEILAFRDKHGHLPFSHPTKKKRG